MCCCGEIGQEASLISNKVRKHACMLVTIILIKCAYDLIISWYAYYSCHVRCEYGVLKSCFGEGDLELYTGKLSLDVRDWRSLPVLSLREAALMANPRNEFHAGRCKCKMGCKQGTCSCKRKNAPCTSQCHGGRSCHNQPDSQEKKVSGNTLSGQCHSDLNLNSIACELDIVTV